MEKQLNPGLKWGKYKVRWECLMVPEIKNAQKVRQTHQKHMEANLKGTRWQNQGSSSTKITNDCNGI